MLFHLLIIAVSFVTLRGSVQAAPLVNDSEEDYNARMEVMKFKEKRESDLGQESEDPATTAESTAATKRRGRVSLTPGCSETDSTEEIMKASSIACLEWLVTLPVQNPPQ